MNYATKAISIKLFLKKNVFTDYKNNADCPPRAGRYVSMVCPNLYEEYMGICTASETLHTPSISEMEEYCFADVGKCRVLEDAALTNSEKRSCVIAESSLAEGKCAVKQKKLILVC
ncbi:MAG: hypothetical protein ACLPX5_00660 [Dissulfurispiraceae bacterium]